MPNGYEWDNDDDTDLDEGAGGSGGPADLRKALKAANRRIKQLESDNTDLTGRIRSNAIAEMVKSSGYNPKIAAFIPADLSDAEAIAGWLAENADVFAPVPSDADPVSEAAVVDGDPLPADAGSELGEALAALKQIQGAQSAGKPLAADPSSLLARINSASTEADLMALLSQL